MAKDDFRCTVIWTCEPPLWCFFPSFWSLTVPGHQLRCEYCEVLTLLFHLQVFLVRKIKGSDKGQLYAMKVLKKATLKGKADTSAHKLCDLNYDFYSIICVPYIDQSLPGMY